MVTRLFSLTILLLLAACGRGKDDPKPPQPQAERVAVPEFIFQVDFGAPNAGEDFWLDWSEPSPVRRSERTVQPVFDQEPVRTKLESCWIKKKQRTCESAGKIKFKDRATVEQTDIPLVLRDGAVFHSDGRMTLEDLPVGRYEIELFFHDAAAIKAGAVQVELQVGLGLVDLGRIEVSTGTNAALPSKIQYEFNITEAKPIRLIFRCIHSGYIINGFRLSKFFGGPTGPEPGDGGSSDPGLDKVGFHDPRVWSKEFGSFSLDSWVQPGGWRRFEESPRQVADVNGDGRADVIGFGDEGVYVALSDGESFTAPELWLADFATFQGNFASQSRKPRLVVDVNGDGLADIVGFDDVSVYVSFSTGTGFLPKERWSNDFSRDAGWRNTDYHPRWIGDVDGDGLADVVAAKDAGLYLALAAGDRFTSAELVMRDFALDVVQSGAQAFDWWHYNHMPRQLFDLDGDGRVDMLGFAEEGLWTAQASGQGFLEKVLTSRFFRVPNGWDYFEQSPRLAGHFGGKAGLADVIGFQCHGAAIVLDVLEQSSGIELASLTRFILERQEFRNYEYDRAPIMVADVTGDGLDDVIFFLTDGTYVAVNQGQERGLLISRR
ncbi:MAG: FG-GAP repeat domain-containing protein [Oligoflexus sp.]